MAFKKKFDGQTTKTITLGKEGNPTSIEGYFLGSKPVDSDYGPGKLHIFQTEEGAVGVWGKTRLDSALSADLVGQMVRATFTGMIQPSKKGRRPSYGFEVEHDPDNTIDMASVNIYAAVDEEAEDEGDADLENAPYVDEAPVARATPPKVAAKAPTSAAQAKVQALLNGRRAS